MDYDHPERRPHWSNAQTNEQQFGLLSFDRHKIQVDGEVDDWKEIDYLYEPSKKLNGLWVDHDERYLYMRLDIKESENFTLFEDGYPLIMLDTIPNQGNKHLDKVTDLEIEDGIDFIIELKGINQSSFKVDAYYDFFRYQYVHQFQVIEQGSEKPSKNSGLFESIHLALSQELLIPNQQKVIPFSEYETGVMKHGNGNPTSEQYDSLADFYVNEKTGVIEIRIPWLLLNMKDPSRREVMSDLYGDQPDGSEIIEDISVSAIIVDSGNEMSKVIDSYPAKQNGFMRAQDIRSYAWETWEVPSYQERLKQSYYLVQAAFREVQ